MAEALPPKPTLKEILQHYTPEQRKAPDKKYGTIEKRVEALYDEAPKKAEKEFEKEVEEQRADVSKQAAQNQSG
jgi:hypothetical protein